MIAATATGDLLSLRSRVLCRVMVDRTGVGQANRTDFPPSLPSEVKNAHFLSYCNCCCTPVDGRFVDSV